MRGSRSSNGALGPSLNLPLRIGVQTWGPQARLVRDEGEGPGAAFRRSSLWTGFLRCFLSVAIPEPVHLDKLAVAPEPAGVRGGDIEGLGTVRLGLVEDAA